MSTARTELEPADDEVITAEELAADARATADDGGLDDVFQVVGDHENEDVSTQPTIDVVRRGVRSLLIAWDGLAVVSGHGYYEAQIDTDINFGSPDDFYNGKATFAIFDGLTTGATYYARVRAVTAAGDTGPWSVATGAESSDEVVTGDVADDAVTAVKIAALTANDVVVGASPSDTSGVIRSSNFSAGTSGWRIRGNGDAEFNDATVRGTIFASAGDVTGTFTAGGGVVELSATDGIKIEQGGGDPNGIDWVDTSAPDTVIGRVIHNGINTHVINNTGLLILAALDAVHVGTAVEGNDLLVHGSCEANGFTTDGSLFFGDGQADVQAGGTADRLLFSTSLDQWQFHITGNQELTLGQTGVLIPNVYNSTTASSANVHVTSSGLLARSTSSVRYKRNVVPFVADDAIDQLEPVAFDGTFGNLARGVPLELTGQRHVGLTAENVAEVFPLAAVYDEDGNPDAYDHQAVLALVIAEVKRLRAYHQAGG